MSDFTAIDARSSIAEISVTTRISIDAPILKRALMSRLPDLLEGEKILRLTREEFLQDVLEDIEREGTYHLSEPSAPECGKVAGGVDEVLRVTAALWRQWFGDASPASHVFEMPFVLTPADITDAYAAALSMGLVERSDDPPETSSATTVLHYALHACIEFGERYVDLAREADTQLAELTVRRVLDHLFVDYTCGIGFSVERLEF